MSKNLRNRCVKFVVYYVIISNIFLPMLLLFFDDPNSCLSISDILSAVVWIISGFLLLIGTIQGKQGYIRIYVMLTTICLLVGPVFLAVYPGEFFCETRNTITMILLIMYFIMMWPFQYCIYLFYKQLASSAYEDVPEIPCIEIHILEDQTDQEAVTENTVV
nr:PREDICTED: uncharacterized protein LOC103312823 [Tribolium castaneum]|eukprot:XP_008192675.1 PREDICTED: uncharacterized protein LOC103312823 [Tribolium castaneum]